MKNFNKTGIILFIFYSFCVIQAYISMYNYKDELSSMYMECGLLNEILINSLITTLAFPLIWLVVKMNKKISLILLAVTYLFMCFIVNENIFTSRVTSWSTFTVFEGITGVIHESYVPIMITLILFYFITKIILMHKRIS